VRAFCRSLRDPFLKVGGSTVLVGCSSVLYRLWGARIVSPTTATFAGWGKRWWLGMFQEHLGDVVPGDGFLRSLCSILVPGKALIKRD
jgi:hypothetical protein